MAWPCTEKSELVERFNALGTDRLVRVLLFERLGDAESCAEGVWVLIAQGDQEEGMGVFMSNVVSLHGEHPQRGDVVEYRTIDVEHKPYVVAWLDGRGNREKGNPVDSVRVKFGPNPYQQEFQCALCRARFDHGGFLLRLEAAGNVVDVPVCPVCWGKGDLLEGVIDMTRHNTSHPIGLA